MDMVAAVAMAMLLLSALSSLPFALVEERGGDGGPGRLARWSTRGGVENVQSDEAGVRAVVSRVFVMHRTERLNPI